MQQQFTAVYKKTKKWYVAWIEEIPGVNTQGKTRKEAKENLQEALGLILETNRMFTLQESTHAHLMREPITVATA